MCVAIVPLVCGLSLKGYDHSHGKDSSSMAAGFKKLRLLRSLLWGRKTLRKTHLHPIMKLHSGHSFTTLAQHLLGLRTHAL
jgi:hypothetical protein